MTSSQEGDIVLNVLANKVGYQMPIYIYDGSEKLVGTAYYNVHPLQTTWKQNPSNTNWNEWSNWTNGSPYLCTDVVIPSNATIYPSLDGVVVNGDEFGCNRIQFESRAAVEKVFKLNYTEAFVDVELNSDRYYLLSAPLQNVYTGDMFIALNGDAVTLPEPWQTLTGSNYQQNRFSPRVYQRLWEKTASTKLFDGSNSDATIQETRWSKRFNALKYDYKEGEGFSLWVQPDRNHDRQFTFRLPKTQTAYDYYNEVTEEMTPHSESGLVRDNAFRFTYEQDQTPRDYSYLAENDRQVFDGIGSLTVSLSAESSTQTFLVGNPFMSHINVQAFLEGNADVISEVKTYNGNTHSSAIAVAGQYITTDETFTRIQPMEAFFVTAKTAGTSLSVHFDETMFDNMGTVNPAPAFNGSLAHAPAVNDGIGQLRICASTANADARALLVSGLDNADRETLFDNEAHPTLAVFTINDGRSLDINGTLADEIPLGIYLEKESDVTLSFHTAGSMNLDDYMLIDRQTGLTYNLGEGVTLTLDGSSINRFYLRRGNTFTQIDDVVAREEMTVNWKNGVVSAEAPSAVLKGIEVFGYNGVLYATHTLATPARTIQANVNENHGIVRLSLSNGETREFKF